MRQVEGSAYPNDEPLQAKPIILDTRLFCGHPLRAVFSASCSSAKADKTPIHSVRPVKYDRRTPQRIHGASD